MKNKLLAIRACPQRSRLRGGRGFTLIELIIYMGILSILLLILSSFFLTSLDTQLETQATSAVDQDSKYILTRLFYDLTNATSVNLPQNPGDETTTLEFAKNGTNFSYSLSGGNMLITQGAFAAESLNSKNSQISNLSFLRINHPGTKPTIQIKFTISSIAQGRSGPDTKSYQTTIGLR